MRLAVVTSSPPFSEGGHLVIARALVRALEEHGHTAEIVLTPQNRFGRQAAAYLATWLTDLGIGGDGGRIDQVISLRFPSYAVRHPAHVCWLNHTMREYYDLWERFSTPLSRRGRVKEGVRRRLIHAADRYLLTKNVTRLFVQSKTVQDRLLRWGRIPSSVLYPPPPQRAYRSEQYGDYVFAVSRLTPLKRMDLLVRAMAEPPLRGARCVIAGEGEETPALGQLIASLGLGDRVRLAGRLDDRALVDHLARCALVCFPPLAEDYGFVAVEAFASSRPVLTCTDSGGPAELVEQSGGGLVVGPRPDELAGAIRRLLDDAALRESLGERARAWAAGITWERTVARLVV
jgi:glycosyltransferase involved in cell wall biosynthesis